MAIRYDGSATRGHDTESGAVTIASAATSATLHSNLTRITACQFMQVDGTARDQIPTLLHAPSVADAQSGTSIGVSLSGTTVTLGVTGTIAASVTYLYTLWGVS